jgi:hypothetical protein
MWYTLFVQEDGAYITHTPTLTLPTDTIGVTTTPQEPDFVTQQWDATARAWATRPNTTRTVLSRREFRRRFTWSERIAIRVAMRTHAELTVRAALEEADVELSDSGAIEVDHADTAAILQMLVSFALLAPERVVDILAPVAE